MRYAAPNHNTPGRRASGRLYELVALAQFVLAPYAIGLVLSIVGGVIFFGGIMASGMSESYIENNPAAVLGLMGPAFGLFALAGLVGLAFLLWIGLVDSQPGENRYGPNPKGL